MIISSCPKSNFRSLVFALPIPSYLLGDLRHGKTHVPLSPWKIFSVSTTLGRVDLSYWAYQFTS